MAYLPDFQFERSPRRRELVQFALDQGWAIAPESSDHHLTVTREGWAAVRIPGRKNHERIPSNSANLIREQLLQPQQQEQKQAALQRQIAELQQQLETAWQSHSQLTLRYQEQERQLMVVQANQEAAEDLLEEQEREHHLLRACQRRVEKRASKLWKQLQWARKRAAIAIQDLQVATTQRQLVEAELKMTAASLEQVEALISRIAALRTQGGDAEQLLQTLLVQLQHILEIKELGA